MSHQTNSIACQVTQCWQITLVVGQSINQSKLYSGQTNQQKLPLGLLVRLVALQKKTTLFNEKMRFN